MAPVFNPYTIKISYHAKKRFIERCENKNSSFSKLDLFYAEQKMREFMFLVCEQTPLSKGSHERKHFKSDNKVFVLSKDLDIVVTYYEYQNLPKTKVKQIRKNMFTDIC